MKKNFKVLFYNKALILLLFISFTGTSVHASATTEKVKEKGAKNIRILERLFEKYPISLKHKNDFDKMKSEWDKNLKDLNLVNRKNKRETEKQLTETYQKINKTLENICNILLSYSNDLLISFQNHIDKEKPTS